MPRRGWHTATRPATSCSRGAWGARRMASTASTWLRSASGGRRGRPTRYNQSRRPSPLSTRYGRQQIDQAVELPQGIWCITRRRADLEEAVDVLWSIPVGYVPAVWIDVELVDGRAGGRRTREVPCHDAAPVVPRSQVLDKGAAFVAGGARLQLRLRDVGTMQLPGLHAVQMGERRREGAVQLGLVDPGAGGRRRAGDHRDGNSEQSGQREQ